MLIHQSQAGCVIGKAGAKLRDMRQDFGVEVKVFAACCPLSTDRIVRVSGSPQKMVKCLIYIIEMLRTVSVAIIIIIIITTTNVMAQMQTGVPRRQSHRRSGLATLSSVGAVP